MSPSEHDDAGVTGGWFPDASHSSVDKRDIGPEELAAVVAAVELVWPPPVVEEAAPARSPWRFSGRWWQPGTPNLRQ